MIEEILKEFEEKFTFTDIHGVEFLIGDTSDKLKYWLKEKLTSFEKKSRKEGIERGKQEFLIIANECLKKGWSLDKFIGVYSELEIIKSNSIKKE